MSAFGPRVGTPGPGSPQFRAPAIERLNVASRLNAPGIAGGQQSQIQAAGVLGQQLTSLFGAASGAARASTFLTDRQRKISENETREVLRVVSNDIAGKLLTGEDVPIGEFTSPAVIRIHEQQAGSISGTESATEFMRRSRLAEDDPDRIDVPGDGSSLEAAQQVTEAFLPEDASSQFKASFARAFMPEATKHVIGARRQAQAEAYEDTGAALAEGVAKFEASGDPTEFQEVLDKMEGMGRGLGLTNPKATAMAKGVLPGIQKQVADGNVDEVERLTRELGVAQRMPAVADQMLKTAKKVQRQKAVIETQKIIQRTMDGSVEYSVTVPGTDYMAIMPDEDINNILRTDFGNAINEIMAIPGQTLSMEEARTAIVTPRMNQAANNGDVMTVRILQNHLSDSIADQAAIKKANQVALANFRGRVGNELVQDVLLNDVSASDAVGQSFERLKFHQEDPDDPHGFDLGTFNKVMGQLRQQSIKTTEADVRQAKVNGKLHNLYSGVSVPAEGDVQLTAADHKAVTNYWMDNGIAVGFGSGSSRIFGKVMHPVKAAMSTRAAGGVPAVWADQIRTGLANGGDAAAEASSHLGAIHHASPQNALNVVSEIKDVAVRERAQRFLDDIEDNVGPANIVTPKGTNVPPGDVMSHGMHKRAGYEEDLMERWKLNGIFTPVELEKKQVTALVFDGKDPGELGLEALKGGLPGSLQERDDSTFAMRNRNRLRSIMGPFGPAGPREAAPTVGEPIIEQGVLNFWEKEAEKAYVERKTAGDSDEDARANARGLATLRTYTKFPPKLWRGEVIFEASAQAFPPQLERDITKKLNALQPTGNMPMGTTAILDTYTPRWDPDTNSIIMVNRKNGMGPQSILRGRNGKPVVFRFSNEEKQAATTWKKTLLENLNENAIRDLVNEKASFADVEFGFGADIADVEFENEDGTPKTIKELEAEGVEFADPVTDFDRRGQKTFLAPKDIKDAFNKLFRGGDEDSPLMKLGEQ